MTSIICCFPERLWLLNLSCYKKPAGLSYMKCPFRFDYRVDMFVNAGDRFLRRSLSLRRKQIIDDWLRFGHAQAVSVWYAFDIVKKWRHLPAAVFKSEWLAGN